MPVSKTESVTDQISNYNNKYDNSYIEETNKGLDDDISMSSMFAEIDNSKRINSKIKELLSVNFESARTSKSITNDRKTTRKYFYKLNNKLEIINFVNILNDNFTENMFDTFCEKKELYSLKNGDKDKLQLCACYYEKNTKNMLINYPFFIVDFYLIIGIRYHKIKKDKIGASIILSKKPVISMTYDDENDEKTFFGLFSQLQVNNEDKQQKFRGINYFVNKYLYVNSEFRNFISQLFTYFGEELNKPILKDVGRTILKNGCFLPELSYQELLLCHTPKDVIKKHIKLEDGINLNFNKYDLNTSWVILKMLPYIDERNYNILLNFYKIGITNFLSFSMFFEGFNEIKTILLFVKNYYFRNAWIKTNPFKFYYSRYYLLKDFDDYFCQSVNLNYKVRLDLTFMMFLQLHDEISRTYRNKCNVNFVKIIKDNSKFNFLENQLLSITNIKRIKTDTDLYEEGENQNNCVFSRLDEIINDEIAIFHWYFNNESITIQFSKSQNGEFCLDEMRAKYNKNCTMESIEHINRRLKDINSMQKNLNKFEKIE